MSTIEKRNPAAMVVPYVAPACSGVTILLGIAVLIAWMIDSLGIARFREPFIPMAPSTAFCFVLLGEVLLFGRFLRRDQGIASAVLRAMAVMAFLISAAVFLDFSLSLQIDMERFIAPEASVEHGFVVGRMSPLTALMFMAVSSAVFLSYHAPERAGRRNLAAQVLASATFIVAAVLVTGYWYGTPLFYGGQIIPVALTTALGFMLLGTGVLFDGPDALLFRMIVSDSVFARFTRLAIPGSVLIILGGGWLSLVVISRNEAAYRVVALAGTALLTSALVAVLMGMVARNVAGAISNAQQALGESEERYRAVFRNAAVGIDLVDIDGRFLEVNEALCTMLGYTPDELLRCTIEEITHPDDVAKSREQLMAMTRGEKRCYRIEKRYLRKDGSVVWGDLSVIGVSDQDGDWKYTIGIIADITERKKVEEALKAGEEQYRALVQASPEAMFVHRRGRFVLVNAATTRLFGADGPEDLVGKPLLDRLHRDFHEIMRERVREALISGGPSTRTEAKLVRLDGSLVDIRVAVVPLTYQGHLALLSIADDITARKKAEETLRESEERYRAVFEQTTEAILIVRPDGETLHANAAALELLGATRDEVVGADIIEYYWEPADRPRFREAIDANGSVKGFSWTARRRDGSKRECDINSTILRDAEGNAIAYLSLIRDLTEIKILERQLMTAQKMEAVGTLAGGVAHDFNNLLQVVLGYSELLLDDERFPAPFRDDLTRIRQAATNGADLVQRLLTFSRKTEFRPRPVNLNRRIEQLRKMLTRTIPKMITIELALADDLAAINADPTQMEQVLMNLAVNARDAMPQGGRLLLETQNVNLDEDYCRIHLGAKPGPHVLLSVSDTGKGMDRDTLVHIFEPFYTTKGPGEGTGLGLAMVYGIVKQHDGFIMCYSEPSRGTTFKIYFAALSVGDETQTVPETPQPRGGSEAILMVDDDELIRQLGSRILTKGGYKVIEASNGNEALDVYRACRDEISLVMLDLIMPEMGGVQCLEELLKINPDVKVIIASGFSVNVQTKTALDSGAMGFVKKPFNMAEMLGTVRTVLDADARTTARNGAGKHVSQSADE